VSFTIFGTIFYFQIAINLFYIFTFFPKIPFPFSGKTQILSTCIFLAIVPAARLMQMPYNAAFGLQMFYRTSAAVTA
jgi:hypothetical protein